MNRVGEVFMMDYYRAIYYRINVAFVINSTFQWCRMDFFYTAYIGKKHMAEVFFSCFSENIELRRMTD